jgi:hypothetical protein
VNRKTLGVTLLVCSILAGGLLAAGIVSTNGTADDGTSTTYGIDSGTLSKTLNVTVYANVGGKLVPIEGANVTVYEITVEENDTVTTITMTKIAVAETGEGGVAQITLPEGNYTIVADYYGLRSVGILSTDTDENVTMVLSSGLNDPGNFQRDLGCTRGHSMMPETNETKSYGNMTTEMMMQRCH